MKNAAVAEKRIYPRRPFRTKVVFEDELGEGLFYLYSEDLSMGGFLLSSEIPLKVGSMLFLSFQLPPHKRFLRTTGEVIRRFGGGDSKPGGMGVRFVGMGETAQKWMKEFLEG